MGQQSDSDVAEHTYDLLFELNCIEPTVLLAVLPQLEFKLKVSMYSNVLLVVKQMWVVQSDDIEERAEVTRLLAKMFCERNSALASQNAPLWLCFVGRYNVLCHCISICFTCTYIYA